MCSACTRRVAAARRWRRRRPQGARSGAVDRGARRAADRARRHAARRLVLARGRRRAGLRPRRCGRSRGGDPRAATAADLDDVCRLADALPEVGLLAGPPVRVQGMSRSTRSPDASRRPPRHVLATTLRTAAEARSAVRLADAVMNEAADRPPLSLCAGPDGRESRPGVRHGRPAGRADAAAGAARRSQPTWAPPWYGITPACSPPAPPCRPKPPARRSSTSRRRSFAGLPSSGPQAAMFQIAAAQLAARRAPARARRRHAHRQPRARLAGLHAERVRRAQRDGRPGGRDRRRRHARRRRDVLACSSWSWTPRSTRGTP